jgi:hypothetical protein
MAKPIDLGPVEIFNGNGAEGSAILRGKVPGQRTALDMYPVEGPNQAPGGALTEHVLYRTCASAHPNFERMNWTAMFHGDPMYRFGVERGGNGKFRSMVFAFEDVEPGVARIPLEIMPPDKDKYTSFKIEIRVNGQYEFRDVEIGGEDSAGPGYRTLKIKN